MPGPAWRVLAAVLVLCFLSAPRKAASAPEKPGALKPMSDKERDELMARLETNLAKLKSLRTRFVQEKHLAIFAEVVEAKGVLLFRKPDMVRFEMTSPFQSVLIARGRGVSKYERIKGRWRRMKLRNADLVGMITQEIAGWMRGRLRAMGGRYELSALKGKETVIRLRPKSPEFRKHIAAIELGIAPGAKGIATVTIREPGADFTRLRFYDQRHDLALPLALFEGSGEEPAALPALAEKSK